MERRTAIKQMFVLAAGATVLHACIRNDKPVTVKLSNLQLTDDQQQLVSDLADFILPSKESPGSKELKLDQFILRMVDDCYSADERKKFSSGLSAFSELTDQKFGKSFSSLKDDERASFLREVDAKLLLGSKEQKEDPAIRFYGTVKELAIRGYMTSEYVMTNKLYYNMIPGTFKGCVKVTDIKDYKTILG